MEKSASFGAFRPLIYGNEIPLTQNFNNVNISSSNQIIGNGTTYSSSLLEGEAFLIEGSFTTQSLFGKISASSQANFQNQISGSNFTPGKTSFSDYLSIGDTIMIQQLSPFISTFHKVVNVRNNHSMSISPNWTGTTTSSFNTGYASPRRGVIYI